MLLPEFLPRLPSVVECGLRVVSRKVYPADVSHIAEEGDGRNIFHLVPHREWAMSLDSGESISIQRKIDMVE